jgi:hypothetical protein
LWHTFRFRKLCSQPLLFGFETALAKGWQDTLQKSMNKFTVLL